jgi:hypothetical protein
MEFTRTRPLRSSQICGYQLQIGTRSNGGDDRWCVRRKARGLYYCQGCEDRLARDEAAGAIRMLAPGSAIGIGMGRSMEQQRPPAHVRTLTTQEA